MTKWIERAAIAVFCLLIFIPCCLTVLGVQSETSENRTLTQAPSILEEGLEFPKAFEAYYNDTFPVRPQLVRMNSWLSLKLLGTAPGDQVIAGRKGFLFFNETVPDYSATREVSDEYLNDLADMLLDVQNAFTEQGTAFVVAFAPNKNSVYPEYMPRTYEQGENTVYDRLLALLNEKGVHAPDLKAELSAAKEEKLVYHKLDTHWNAQGALFAYQAIAKDAMQQNPALELPLYEVLPLTEQTFTGDLASTMLGLKGEEKTLLHSLSGFEADSDDHYAPKLTTRGKGNADVVVYRDSFGTALVPYFAQGTGSAFFTRALPYDLKSARNADLVVIEIAERNIETMLDELSVPVFAPIEDEPIVEEPVLPDEPVEEPPVPGSDIPEPEPFDKSALPDDLDDVDSDDDEWDDYDPFSEPPSAIATQPEEQENPDDVADFRLLITTEATTANIAVLDGAPASATLTVLGRDSSDTQTVTLQNGAFTLQNLKPGQWYAARAMMDGEEINFLMQTQPGGSAVSGMQASVTPVGLQLNWEGDENTTYRVYRSTYLERSWELAAEITGTEVLLPEAGTLQVNYRIASVTGDTETELSAPITLMTPVLNLPYSERDFEQEYLPLVSREDQIIYVMARDIDGRYSIPINAMLTSTGESESRTPTGAFKFWRKREWMTWTEGQYSQYNMDFDGRLKTHSVLFAQKNHDNPIFNMREKLGRPVSGGCLRLTVTDAGWLFERFEIDDYIEILDGVKHPTLIQELKDTLPEL